MDPVSEEKNNRGCRLGVLPMPLESEPCEWFRCISRHTAGEQLQMIAILSSKILPRGGMQSVQ